MIKHHPLGGDTLFFNFSKVETVSFGNTKSNSPDREKSTPLSLIASPTIIRKFRRRNDEQCEDDRKTETSLFTKGTPIPPIKQTHLRVTPHEEERLRSRTWGPGIDDSETMANVIKHETEVNHIFTEKVKLKLQNSDQKQKTNKKFRELVAKVLKKNLEHCSYNAELSRKRCTHISQILETIFRSTLNRNETEYKILALVYIGEIRGSGMQQSFQYNMNADTDIFVLETYRNDNMFATGVVFATLLENQIDIIC